MNGGQKPEQIVMSEAIVVQMFDAVPAERLAKLDALCREYESHAVAVLGRGTVVGFDWTNIASVLIKVLPGMLAMLKAGNPLGAVLAVLDFVLPLLIPDSTLVSLARQIIEILLGAFA